MDVINLFPSPPHLLRLFVRLALSLFNSSVRLAHRRAIIDRRSPVDFDIDSQTGFFPQKPLPRLPEQFTLWECALEDANDKLSLGEDTSDEAVMRRSFGETWRSAISEWPVLDTRAFHEDIRFLQRAHLVLAWLVSFYAHSIPPSEIASSIIIPKSLALPLVSVSRALGIAPVLTFADTVLWNWELVNPDQPFSSENIKFVNLFSGTEDERNFYLASAKAELRGIEALRIIDEYNNLPVLTDLTSISKIARDLHRLQSIIEDLAELIQSIRPTCDPHVFYWVVRPWYEGSGSQGPNSPAWIYEGVQRYDKLDLSGPSAGQSSVMHALDIFLDIDHTIRKRRYPPPSAGNQSADHGFMERMRRYMPGKHREYLAHLAATPRSIRDLAQRIPALRDPYDGAVLALKRFRDEHMKIACLYIVTMSHSNPVDRAGCPVSATMRRVRKSADGAVRGTGGTEVSNLLKAGRDATRRAALKHH